MKKAAAIFCTLLLCLILLCACSMQDIKSEVKNVIAPTEPTTARPTATVTFPEGFTLRQIAEKLEENGVCQAAEFIRLTNDEAFVSSLGYAFTEGLFEKERAFYLEGYIFPDTYEFYLNDRAENIIIKILDNTEKKFNQEYMQKAAETGYTFDEIITLASIIQEEAFTNESMKLISSVLYNRIVSPSYGKLQCDVTINYVNDNILDSPYLTGDTEKFRELYNTYKCEGIPQGPICCPGIEAVDAALNPDDTDYYFFVTDKDWNYYFSETYEEHRRKCKEIGL